MRKPDVLVVGGGPAGSATATLLARLGHDVCLIDRAHFPRGKACGESINPGAVHQLEELGWLATVRDLPHQVISGWEIHPQQGRVFSGRFPPGEYAIAMDRVALDSALLAQARKAGVEVRTGLCVTEILRENGRAAGVVTREEGSHSARMIVGADGLRSVVMRRLGLLDRGPRLKKVGLTGHVRGSTRSPDIGELHLFPWGCAGIVQVDPTSVNVVMVLNAPFARQASGNPQRCFDDLTRSIPTLEGGARLGEVHPTGPFDYPAKNVVADGALLVGDAAGYFDPFTGEGIYRALRGARMAADVIHRCLEADDCSAEALSPYAEMHRQAFDGGVRRQKAIEAVVSRPRWLQAAAAGMSHAAWAADRLVSIIGDVPPKNGRAAPIPGVPA